MSLKLNRRTFLGCALTFGATCAASPAEAFGVTAAEKKAEVQNIKSKLDAMNEELESVGNRLNAAQDVLSNATTKVETCQGKIEAAEKKIKKLQGHLETRATSMYRNGSMSYLDVLLGVGSFSDFTSVWDTLNKLNEEDADLVAQAKVAKSELESAKKELVEQQTQARNARDEIASLQSSIQTKASTYESEYSSLSAEYKRLLKKEERAQARREAAAQEAYSPSVTTTTNTTSSTDDGDDDSSSSSEDSSSSASSIPTHGSVVDYAASRIGCPYVWGASGPNSFDCSGLVMWCYAKIGISLPHYTESILSCASARMSPSSAAAGDVLYRYGHVAISTGGTNYIHAPHSGANVSYGSGGSWTYALRF